MKIKIKESELKQVIKKVISEARNLNNNSIYVEKEFSADIPEIGVVDIIIGGKVKFVDQGIGNYEFWGSTGTQSEIVPETIGYELAGGDTEGIENEILEWMEQNSEMISMELEDEAKRESGFDQ